MSESSFTPEHSRAVRAVLQWSQADLASAANVGISTIADFEKGSRTPIAANLAAIQAAFERAGVVFTSEGPLLWAEVSLFFMTAASQFEMRFRYRIDQATPVQDVIAAFGTPEGDHISLSMDQVATPALKAAIDGLVHRHGTGAPQLNKLKKVIGDLADGEYFLILPMRPASTEDRLALETRLHLLNHPKEQAGDGPRRDDLFALLFERYDMSQLRADRHNLIGADQEIRTCRFCNRTTSNGASFKKAAHVIPTALGNDFLKSAQECDDCNAYFGNETEPSLIAMLDVERVFLGTQGRGKNDGRPKLYFGQDSMVHDGKKVVIKSHSLDKDEDGTIQLNLGKGRPIVPMKVYRALVKIVISVVAEEHLPHLKKTIEWVRHGKHGGLALPLVAVAVALDLPPDPSAQIAVYTRRAPDPILPHIIGEFRLGCFMFVYAIPFSNQDAGNLVGFFDEPIFRETFKHYMLVSKWQQRDLSSTRTIIPSPQLRFKPK